MGCAVVDVVDETDACYAFAGPYLPGPRFVDTRKAKRKAIPVLAEIY